MVQEEQKSMQETIEKDSRRNDCIVVRGAALTSSRDEVLRMLDCTPESASYEIVEELYEELYEETLAAMEPILMIRFGKIPAGWQQLPLAEGTEVIYTIGSIGGEVSHRSKQAFAQGDPLTGMILNAMADSALFHLDDELAPVLKEACAVRKKGILKRLEAPQDIPMEVQQLIYEQTNAGEICGMNISSGYMLDPVKSSANLYLLTDDVQVFRAQHDCSSCPRKGSCQFSSVGR